MVDFLKDFCRMTGFPPYLQRKLHERKEKGNYRSLPENLPVVDFLSNDYLGLARDRNLSTLIEKNYSSFEAQINGATGSRLLSGNHGFFENLEEQIAEIFKGEKALLFNSGYNANLALLSCLPQKGDTIIYDEFTHVCLKEGARLSFAKRHSFKHNDLRDLENKLNVAEGHIYVVVESVYSMDGDSCPLPELVKLCKKYQAYVIIDEAHSTGTEGESGSGLACSLNLEKEILARVYTFGKAMGVHGACIVGDKNLIDYLVNFATPFIYTTALPLHSLVSIACAFDYLKRNTHFQDELKEKISFYKKNLKLFPSLLDKYDTVSSESATQVIIVPGNEQAKRLALHLNGKGFNIKPILSPTVKEGKERIRICLHRYDSDEEIERLIKEIADY